MLAIYASEEETNGFEGLNIGELMHRGELILI